LPTEPHSVTLPANDPVWDIVSTSLPTVSGKTYENDAFRIVGNSLLSARDMDHEFKDSRDILVRATDSTGLNTEQVFQISITDVDEPPQWKTDASDYFPINENGDSNETVGTVHAVDPEGSAVTYRIEWTDGPFNMLGDKLLASSPLDFESFPKHHVKIIASDGEQESLISIDVTVVDVDEKPTDLIIDNTTISSHAIKGAVVGIVSANDPEGGTLTFKARDSEFDEESLWEQPNYNTTTNVESLKYYTFDFTDTDGDGMTDVAERKYGFDPNDASSFPNKDYTFLVEDGRPTLPESTGVFDPNNEIRFQFDREHYLTNRQGTSNLDKLASDRELFNLTMPILLHELGLPPS